MAETLFHFCRGYSHIETDKPCQDCAYAESSGNLSMAIVSDGHGGEQYFRSDKGAKLMVRIAAQTIRTFLAFDNYYVGLKSVTSENHDNGNTGHLMVNEKLRWLFSSIIAQWNKAVEKDVRDNPLTDREKEVVDQKFLDEFLASKSHEKTYGCTLIAYFSNGVYRAAFQIGDGKLLTMSIKGGKVEFEQPVPWDDRCFLNKTTSVCDSDAINEFRYWYSSDSTFPDAVFLGSDGLDDTYGDGALLEDFYMNLYLEIAKGRDKAQKVLERDLPEISKRGSKDDMSVAVVYDERNLAANALRIVECQLRRNEVRSQEIATRISELEEKIAGYEDGNTLDEHERINLRYALKDLAKECKRLDQCEARKRRLNGRKGS